jgi:hypothetical protein
VGPMGVPLTGTFPAGGPAATVPRAGTK